MNLIFLSMWKYLLTNPAEAYKLFFNSSEKKQEELQESQKAEMEYLKETM